jgi:nucleotide-binding universal stress UspA family protein
MKFPPSRILVAVDGSENSVRASEVAIRLAKDFGASLIVVSVVPAARYIGGLDVPRELYNNYYQNMNDDATGFANSVSKSASEQGVKATASVERSETTSVVETVVNKANSEDAQLIVVGTRGLGGFKKLLLGSVSSGVIAHAKCNVLVVR